MASELRPLGTTPTSVPNASTYRFVLVVSSYHDDITYPLRDGARDVLLAAGALEAHIRILEVPGAYELTLGAQKAIQSHGADAVICLGVVIKGDTRHDEYINAAVAQGLTRVSLDHSKPVMFGLLTTENHQQAVDRAGGKHGNKGAEAAQAALAMLNL